LAFRFCRERACKSNFRHGSVGCRGRAGERRPQLGSDGCREKAGERSPSSAWGILAYALFAAMVAGIPSSSCFVPVLGVVGAVIAWAYQSGTARLGVIDLFACEISTLCPVATVVDTVRRYAGKFDQAPTAAAHTTGPRQPPWIAKLRTRRSAGGVANMENRGHAGRSFANGHRFRRTSATQQSRQRSLRRRRSSRTNFSATGVTRIRG
jgi:hypothetical protein